MIESSGSFEEEVIGEAILPALSGLERLYEGVSALFPVFARMAVLRVVAAADLSTEEARPEVNPRVPSGDAFLTHIRLWGRLLLEMSEVKARSRHATGPP